NEARPKLVDRAAPVLAVATTARTVVGAPVKSRQAIFIGARRVAQVEEVPYSFYARWIRRIGVRVRIECRERGSPDTRDPRLGRRIEYVDDGGSVAPNARERGPVPSSSEPALALHRHLFEDQVLALDVPRTHVVFADRPAGADDIGEVVFRDPCVLIELGLPREVIRCVVHKKLSCVWRNRQLCLDVG